MRFRLITYNIHRAIGTDRKFDPRRIIEILEHYEADIVLLQEVDRGVPRSDNMDLAAYFARQLRYDYRAVGMNVFLKRGKYGNATLSRHPIGRQNNLDLSIAPFIRRGAQHTCVRLNHEVEIDVFNVHLGLLAHERQRQVDTLLAAPAVRNLPPERACLIAGDTNDWRGLLHRRQFRSAGFRCATNRGGRLRRSIRTFPSYAPSGGLDKIYYRGPLELLRVDRSRLKLARIASDHLPVVADFRVLPPSAAADHDGAKEPTRLGRNPR